MKQRREGVERGGENERRKQCDGICRCASVCVSVSLSALPGLGCRSSFHLHLSLPCPVSSSDVAHAPEGRTGGKREEGHTRGQMEVCAVRCSMPTQPCSSYRWVSCTCTCTVYHCSISDVSNEVEQCQTELNTECSQ